MLRDLVVEAHDQDGRRPLADEVAQLLAAAQHESRGRRHRTDRQSKKRQRRNLRRRLFYFRSGLAFRLHVHFSPRIRLWAPRWVKQAERPGLNRPSTALDSAASSMTSPNDGWMRT